MPKARTLYFAYNSCRDLPASLSRRSRRAFGRSIRKNPVDRLVIDLSNPRAHRRLVIMAVYGPVILMLAAGSLSWPAGWAFSAFTIFYTLGSRLLILRRNPDLLMERAESMSKAGVEPWDRVLVPLIGVLLPTRPFSWPVWTGDSAGPPVSPFGSRRAHMRRWPWAGFSPFGRRCTTPSSGRRPHPNRPRPDGRRVGAVSPGQASRLCGRPALSPFDPVRPGQPLGHASRPGQRRPDLRPDRP